MRPLPCCARLRDLLLGDRFRLDGWRLRAVGHTLAQLEAERSPAPFSLSDEEHNRDLLAALVALADDAPVHVPRLVWADLDYGGLSILARGLKLEQEAAVL